MKEGNLSLFCFSLNGHFLRSLEKIALCGSSLDLEMVKIKF